MQLTLGFRAGEYHAVNQIVGKGLHQADDDSFNFTRTLLERLETTKAERADDDAIVDNDAGQAYVEQFAQETFARAERTLRADRVTRQTADTFDAAATFFDLTREWVPALDAETLAKIKFAKWNAARILKAIREGRDPNESNPKQPEAAAATAGAEGEDDEDAELRRLAAQDPEARELVSPQPRAATVEDVPDEAAAPSSAVPHQPSPPMPPSQVQDGYFPPPPPPASSQPSAPAEPFVPSPMSASPSPATQVPPQPSPQIPTKLPSQFAPPPPAPQEPSAPPAWSAPPPVVPAAPAPVLTSAPAPAPAPVPTTTMHHKDLNQAQKHAKWAISALNFEDVPTAVQELRNALAMLGAQ